jgi:hypothetical protein
METEVTFCVGAMPPFSSKNIKQTLIPVEVPKMSRTLTGDLVLLAPYTLKYKSTLSGNDRLSFLSDALVPGTVVHVSCVVPLTQKLENGKATLSKQPVQGKIAILKPDGSSDKPVSVTNKTVTSDSPTGVVVYNPILKMMVKGYKLSFDEWQAGLQWEIELEEV